MRQVAKKGLLTAVATGGVLAVTTGGFAYADAGARGIAAGSLGAASGDTVQAPVHAPVTVCDNTVNVVGSLLQLRFKFGSDHGSEPVGQRWKNCSARWLRLCRGCNPESPAATDVKAGPTRPSCTLSKPNFSLSLGNTE